MVAYERISPGDRCSATGARRGGLMAPCCLTLIHSNGRHRPWRGRRSDFSTRCSGDSDFASVGFLKVGGAGASTPHPCRLTRPTRTQWRGSAVTHVGNAAQGLHTRSPYWSSNLWLAADGIGRQKAAYVAIECHSGSPGRTHCRMRPGMNRGSMPGAASNAAEFRMALARAQVTVS